MSEGGYFSNPVQNEIEVHISEKDNNENTRFETPIPNLDQRKANSGYKTQNINN